MIKTAILTISDTRDINTDGSGKALKDILNNDNFVISHYEVIKDDIMQIRNRLIHYSDISQVDLILTTGGTGLGPRDVTPEATLEIIDKRLPGVSELIRSQGLKKTNRAVLSRAEAGTRKKTLIINLPGSISGAKESLFTVLEIIPHAIDMIKGKGHQK